MRTFNVHGVAGLLEPGNDVSGFLRIILMHDQLDVIQRDPPERLYRGGVLVRDIRFDTFSVQPHPSEMRKFRRLESPHNNMPIIRHSRPQSPLRIRLAQ